MSVLGIALIVLAGLIVLPFFIGGVADEVARQGGIGGAGTPWDAVDSDLYESKHMPWDD